MCYLVEKHRLSILVKDDIRAVIHTPVWKGTSHPAPELLHGTTLRENTKKKRGGSPKLVLMPHCQHNKTPGLEERNVKRWGKEDFGNNSIFPTKNWKEKAAFNFEEGFWFLTVSHGSETVSDAMWTLDLKCHYRCETTPRCKDLRMYPDVAPPVHPSAPVK